MPRSTVPAHPTRPTTAHPTRPTAAHPTRRRRRGGPYVERACGSTDACVCASNEDCSLTSGRRLRDHLHGGQQLHVACASPFGCSVNCGNDAQCILACNLRTRPLLRTGEHALAAIPPASAASDAGHRAGGGGAGGVWAACYARSKDVGLMVDVEADGPIPADYSMVSVGAIVVEPDLRRTFYGRLRADIGSVGSRRTGGEQADARRDAGVPERRRRDARVRASGSRDNTTGRPIFVSDNNGFDWQFINWYFHALPGQEPVRPLVDEPRLALQGPGQGHVAELQAPAARRSTRITRSTMRAATPRRCCTT